MSEEGYIEYMCQQFDHALVAQVDPNAIAAIVIEPVQGEGGFIPTPPRFLERIREACTQHGIVMIADEIQCGFGRTGKLFAIEHYNIVPDLIAMGKSLAAGMPIAAVTGRAEIVDAPHAGGLGGTYSGNPLACVAAIEATNQIKSPEFLLRSEEIGKKLRAHLLHLQDEFPDLIGDVRGLGPMLAIEIIKDPESKAPDMETTAAITAATLKRGLITIRAGLYSNCIRFLPPLIISDDQLEEAMTVLKEALVEVASS
jgi:4-aminobutyrate aminotransferase/(S)-3-amino-2-methylpropionate transaminase